MFGPFKILKLFPDVSKLKFTLTVAKISSLYPSVIPHKSCNCNIAWLLQYMLLNEIFFFFFGKKYFNFLFFLL